jgi:hypothetical protein
MRGPAICQASVQITSMMTGQGVPTSTASSPSTRMRIPFLRPSKNPWPEA